MLYNKTKELNVIGVKSTLNSFGRITKIFMQALHKTGYDLHFRPYWTVDKQSDPFIAKFEDELDPNVPNFLIHWGQVEMENSMRENTIVYTMTETTAIAKLLVKTLNKARAVIVPTEWNARVFRKSGVKVPLHIVPLGVDVDVFKPDIKSFPAAAIFSTAGRIESGRSRKGLDRVIAAFLLAFPKEADAWLWIKTYNKSDVLPTYHPRIQVVAQNLTEMDLARFYQKSLCFVSGAWGEGWGWHIHEAMACGKPIIATRWGGLTAYFKGNQHGCELTYNLEDCSNPYGLEGNGAVPTIESLAKAMRAVYENRLSAFLRGLQGFQDVKYLTIKHMQTELLKVLKRYV